MPVMVPWCCAKVPRMSSRVFPGQSCACMTAIVSAPKFRTFFFSLYDVKRSRNTARIRDVLSAVSKRLQRRPHDRGPAVQVLTKLLRFHRPLDVRVRRGN